MKKMKILTIILVILAMIFTALLVMTRNKDREKLKSDESTIVKSKVYIINENHTGLKKIPVTLDKSKKEGLLSQSITELQRIDNKANKDTAKIGDLKILGVKQDKNIAVVDISKESLKWEPSEESLILDSIIMSLTEIKGVDKVQILIDGQKVDVFMNAFIISEPLSRESVTNNIYKN